MHLQVSLLVTALWILICPPARLPRHLNKIAGSEEYHPHQHMRQSHDMTSL